MAPVDRTHVNLTLYYSGTRTNLLGIVTPPLVIAKVMVKIKHIKYHRQLALALCRAYVSSSLVSYNYRPFDMKSDHVL